MQDVFGGLRVVDLSPTRVGAQISQVLADFGAEVIWIEPPGGADLRRHGAFPFWARGKKSIVLDLHDDDDAAAARRLVSTADVVIETFRPGVMQRLGLGHEALAADNLGLITLSISGFGTEGPFAAIAGYEQVVMAKLGVLANFSRMGPGGGPVYVTVPFASFAASQVGLHGLLAALHERETSGLGQHVETNLAQAFTAIDTWSWAEHVVASKWPDAFTKQANFDDEGRPTSPFAYRLLIACTRDGHWLQFAATADRLFHAVLRALDHDWMLTDPEWAGLPVLTDPEKRMRAWTMLQGAVARKTLAEWQAVFDADPNVFAEVFRSGAEVLEHPQLLHDGSVVELRDRERGIVRQPGALVRLSETPARLGVGAPLLDEHRRELLRFSDGHDTAPHRAAVPPAGRAVGALPLAGITILELAGLFAAPHGTTMLTDLGARVIKIEPIEGDPIRPMIAFPEAGGAKVMQGKDSVCIDFTTPEGLALVHELAARVDVVMQGFRAGATTRLGLDYATLSARNPRLVYVNAPGYGVDGPYGHRPA